MVLLKDFGVHLVALAKRIAIAVKQLDDRPILRLQTPFLSAKLSISTVISLACLTKEGIPSG
ncbi:hypothetical protein BBP40_006026, partial [Aspergillus hancockii]